MTDDMRFDLSQILNTTDPTSVEAMLKQAAKEAKEIRLEYFGKLKEMDGSGIAGYLRRLDSFIRKHDPAFVYVRILFAVESLNPDARRLNSVMTANLSTIDGSLAFTDSEIGEALKRNPLLLKNPELSDYLHYLETIRIRAEYSLSPAVEELVAAKDKGGIRAWSQLESEWRQSRLWGFDHNGANYRVSVELWKFLVNQDRELRRKAMQAMYGGVGDSSMVWVATVRGMFLDHLAMCEARGYPSILSESLIANDITEKTVEALHSAITKNRDMVFRYFKLLEKLLGVKKLASWDLNAPIPGDFDARVSWAEAKSIAIQVYSGFDPEWGHFVEELFEKSRVDVEDRPGRNPSGISFPLYDKRTGFPKISFTGNYTFLSGFVHEIGHAVQYSEACKQNPINAPTFLGWGRRAANFCMVELGSEFGVALYRNWILAKADTLSKRQNALLSPLKRAANTLLSLSNFNFEKRLYEEIAAGRGADGEEISRLWVEERDKVCENSLERLPEERWAWAPRPQIFRIDIQFYNYPYDFGALLASSLHQLYVEHGQPFASKIKDLFAAGYRRSPVELVSELGFDLESVDFWNKGYSEAKDCLKQLEEMPN